MTCYMLNSMYRARANLLQGDGRGRHRKKRNIFVDDIAAVDEEEEEEDDDVKISHSA